MACVAASLGFDCSTQSLKATLLCSHLDVIHQETVIYDTDLPHYKTKEGVWKSEQKEDLQVRAPSLMFAEAFELALSRCAEKVLSGLLLWLMEALKVDLSSLQSISASGQQHGSVYWAKGASKLLSQLDPSRRLTNQLAEAHAFALEAGPIWMDSSTNKQCRELEARMGGALPVAIISGSRAYERFTGNQIARILQEEKAVFTNCEHISLVSSFLPSLLLGKYCPIDVSDGSGMNLLDIRAKTPSWHSSLLAATLGFAVNNLTSSRREAEAGLQQRLGDPVYSHTVVGTVHPFFRRFKIPSACRVVAGSGDNPCSLVGVQVVQKGDVAVSLGTSDTLCALVDAARAKPALEGHLLASPVHADNSALMAMLCFKNGSLTRQHVRDIHESIEGWAGFSSALRSTPFGNKGALGVYFVEPEIIPRFNARTLVRFRWSAQTNGFKLAEGHSALSPAEDARAVVEGHFASLAVHARSFGLHEPRRIIATGGASRNKEILQILANVFQAAVFTTSAGADAAAMGAAMRAAHGMACEKAEKFIPFHVFLDACSEQARSVHARSERLVLAAEPQENTKKTAVELCKRYAQVERYVCEKYGEEM